MKRISRKPKEVAESRVSLGAINKENLPYPIVYYPNHYGTFFGFAKNMNSSVVLCTCNEPLVNNYIRLKQKKSEILNSDHLRMAPLESWFFPNCIAEQSLSYKENPVKHLTFIEGLCHRCNLITPSLRYCHEMYGTQFVQQYGWYINQAYLKVGVHPLTYDFLPDICPQSLQDEINSLNQARNDYMNEHKRIMDIVQGPKRPDIEDDEITYWANVRYEEVSEMNKLHKIYQKKLRQFTNKIQNIARQEFGFRNVGEGWVSETILFQIIKKIYDGMEILRHYRPEWLEGLELDIYIPEMNLGFEYQGQQHFHPIKIWGGKKSLKELQARDQRKAELCNTFGVRLIVIDYTEPLNEEYVRGLL